MTGNIHVTDASGETRTAANWAGRSGRAGKLRGARVTASHVYQAGAVVCVHARDTKEPWCPAASDVVVAPYPFVGDVIDHLRIGRTAFSRYFAPDRIRELRNQA